MKLSQSDWNRLGRSLPKELHRICRMAGQIQYDLNKVENGLRFNHLYPEDVTSVLADTKDIVLEYISLVQQRGAPEQTEQLIIDLRETFKITDMERDRLTNAFNSMDGKRNFGQIHTTLQKVKELLHGYIYKTILQAKSDFDNKFMQTFVATSVARRGVAPKAEKEDKGGKLEDLG